MTMLCRPLLLCLSASPKLPHEHPCPHHYAKPACPLPPWNARPAWPKTPCVSGRSAIGFPQPLRDASGNRLYPAEQVQRLQLVRRLLDAGLRPNKVVGLDAPALAQLLSQHSQASSAILSKTNIPTLPLPLCRAVGPVGHDCRPRPPGAAPCPAPRTNAHGPGAVHHRIGGPADGGRGRGVGAGAV